MGLRSRLRRLAARASGLAAAAALLGQTQDFMQVTVNLIQSVIPVMVLVLVLKLLFSSFKDVSK